MAYPYSDIEARWQRYWDEHATFRTPGPGDAGFDADKPKYYVLDMFPYPSGAGLHVGHPEGYTATDILARYKRMKGFNVLHPIGWDAFGLPAEQYAVETNTHPRITTERNIATFKRQLKALGFSYDWSREINTTDPKYVRWTQWIFEQLYERGLAYQHEAPVWWCPHLGTVLANEEVIDGKSERGGHPCERVNLRQWMLKITAYADRLLEGLDDLDWPESTKEMQRNWIGRSEGADVDFPVVALPEQPLRVFTTRPDTLFGATYMVLAPEHPLVAEVTTPEQREAVEAYIEQAAGKSDLERTELQKEKTGVFTGGYAINPVNGEEVPIWIADYVLATYGTGAIMAVPAHDERDYEFAQKYDLPIREVVSGGDVSEEAYTGDGRLVNSSSAGQPVADIAKEGVSLDGLAVDEAKRTIIDWLEDQGMGRARVNFKLRDWLFSRQRYWGEPFPVLFDEDERPHLVPADELPVTLPEVEDFKPSGRPEGPLAAQQDWVQTSFDGQPARRETNTMPQWAGSCWYYLRYLDPDNDEQLVDPEKEKYWLPVDLYVGGAEHAVLHLLYARFWHKVLYDAGVVATEEPFRRLVHQGMILGETEYTTYKDEQGRYVSAEHVERREGEDGPHYWSTEHDRPVAPMPVADDTVEKQGSQFVLVEQPEIVVEARAHKMSKSRGNVVNPDDVVRDYGADALRLYEMFMGPLEQTKPWSTTGVDGVARFLARVWRLVTDDTDGLAERVQERDPSKDELRTLHQLLQKVSDDVEGLRFNTAIAAMMEFLNEAKGWDTLPRAVAEPFVLVLSPFAPHLAEELWRRLGHDETLAYAPWPEAEEEYLKEDEVEMAVQVNGKVRGTIRIPTDADREAVLSAARAEENVARYLQEGTVRKEIYVPGRIVNFVVG